MAEKVIGKFKDYITLDDAAMTLVRMRMRRTVRNASKEFLLRFFATGSASGNKCRARDYLPPRRQWARPGPGARGKKNTGQLQVASIMRCIRAHEKSGTLEATEWGGRLVRLVADVQRRVGECDIRKFFDNIRHDEILKALDRYAAEIGNLDPAAREVVCAYLRCYWLGEVDGVSRGIPQGGSLSPVLANMVMAQADEAVLRHSSEKMFYARYCDDMVIAATDESLCRRAMDAYFAALDQLHLPPHPIADFTYGTDYFEAKSKGPFSWCAAEKGTRGCAPWVSFLGNQVRFDGAVRVRKDTVRKHVLKIKEEVGSAIGMWERLGGKLRAGVKTALFYKSLRRRLVAKGVGYLRAGPVPNDGICWAAAFPNLTKNVVCARQMRTLDFVRERALGAVRRVLALKGMRYLGRPSSYYGYLQKLERPAQGQRKSAILPYSEL